MIPYHFLLGSITIAGRTIHYSRVQGDAWVHYTSPLPPTTLAEACGQACGRPHQIPLPRPAGPSRGDAGSLARCICMCVRARPERRLHAPFPLDRRSCVRAS